MYSSKLLFLFFVFLLFIPAQGFGFQSESVQVQLQGLIDDALESDSSIPGILLHVESPGTGLSWSGSAGVSDLETGAPLSPDATARIASNTKTYTAAGILRLVELGDLELSGLVREYIPADHAAILSGDGYDLDSITILHLLTHTSGMFDHAASDTYFEKIMNDPQHVWTRTEQIQGCVDWGDPLFDPGTQFSYSDTGYIILGEIIERKTGKSLGAALKELLNYQKLGLSATWQETVESKPVNAGARAHQYFQGTDTYEFHPSLDLYGGGGLVSSAKDMALFYQSMFAGKVFDDPATLALMTQKVDFPGDYTPRSDYRIGLFRNEINNTEVFSHSGFWGTMVYYIPELDASIALVVTDFGKVRMMRQLMADVVSLLQAE